MENFEISIEFNPEIIQRIYSIIKEDPDYKPKPYRRGMLRIEQALEATSDTRALRLGNGILEEVADLFTKQFPRKKAIIVADTNTYAAAGKRVEEALRKADIEQESPFIFESSTLHAEYSCVTELVECFKKYEAIPIAVGSGTINDLTKLASHLVGKRYMCVATAASMDGYTAYGASIRANDIKQLFPCVAPQAVLVDTDIILQSPKKMTTSGYADLLAKMTAGADWIIADWLGVEPIDEKAWKITQSGFHEALLLTEKASMQDEHTTIAKLMEGLMLGGFAMQLVKTNRPASGAEHLLSNFWELERRIKKTKAISHGDLLSIGILAITAFYEWVVNAPLEELDIQKCCADWPDAEEYERQAKEAISEIGLNVCIQEAKAKYISREQLGIQLQQLKEYWPEIRERLSQQLIPYREMKAKMEQIGLPTNPEEVGISRAHLRQTFLCTQYMNRRFTVLDLALRTGHMNTWLNGLFGKGKIWEI